LKRLTRGVEVFAYANNHYAGHAPDTVNTFRKLLHLHGSTEPKQKRGQQRQASLFD
jgi:uncharacterized protein YecE (DUF72 family)